MKEAIMDVLAIAGILFLLSAGIGCDSRPPKIEPQHATVPVHILTSEQKFQALKDAAKAHGVGRWYIFCVPGGDSQHNTYQAEAFQIGDNDTSNRKVADGAKDWWANIATTPEDAAYGLALKLQKPAYIEAESSPDTPMPDCNYKTIFDSKHEGRIPCSRNP